jgi:hypothetical protein
MGKTYKTKVEVGLELDERDLAALIEEAHYQNIGFEWWKAKNPEEQERAREELLKETGEEPSIEEEFARILVNGGKLSLLEAESDWHWSGHKEGELLFNIQIRAEGCVPVGGTWHDVGIDDIARGLVKYAEGGGYNECGLSIKRILEDGDITDADAVFQYAAYGEVVCG